MIEVRPTPENCELYRGDVREFRAWPLTREEEEELRRALNKRFAWRCRETALEKLRQQRGQ